MRRGRLTTESLEAQDREGSSGPSGAELSRLRKLARETARERRETPTTVHLLAAIAGSDGPARELLETRRFDAATLLRAARSFDEDAADAIGGALAAARDLAHRASIGYPRMGDVSPASRGDRLYEQRGETPQARALRPTAPAAPGGMHVLVALLSNRRYAAYRALAQCGADIARLRQAAARVAFGLREAPRTRARTEETAAPAPREAAPSPQRTRSAARATATRRKAVEVPLFPPGARPAAPSVRPAPSPARPAEPPAAAVEAAPVPAELVAALELDPARFPLLAKLGRNLTAAAARGELDPVIGRDGEIEQALDVLAKRHGNSPVLVGAAGVGKTSVARGIAQRFAGAAVATGRRLLVEVPVGELVAGTSSRGSLAERVATLRQEVRSAEGRVVLFVDELHELFTGGVVDEAAAELKAALARGELPLVGATGPDDYRRAVESDPALARRFTVVPIEEPDEAEAVPLLRAVARSLADHHGVGYRDAAIAAAVSWSMRYLPGRALPDKAVGLLDLAGARLRRRLALESATREGTPRVEPEHVAEVVSELADVPIERLLETDGERMMRLEELLRERVIGHDEPLARVAAVLRRNAAGLRGARPIGTFLLLGPTGVGKTETAKAIAEVLFHSPEAMTRLDMSEYAEAHAIARLIGAPPGYVGHEAGGALTEAVRRRPYQVLLLDEIEKAHRDVLEGFLQVFDEGRLTDGRGRTVDCKSTVIVLTSNLGADELAAIGRERRVGFAARDGWTPGRRDERRMREAAVGAARKALPPELYNRLDEVLFFGPLGREEVRAIAERLLAALGQALALRGVTLVVDDAALDALLEQGGYDAELGARPMRRAVARLVEAPLAELLLTGELSSGAVARVRRDRDGVRVDKAPSERASA